MSAPSSAAALPRSRELLGHPTCLFTLFFTELWERFSFYGMKALLILYMVNYLFWSQQEASTVLRWYAGLVYVTPVIGGWLADRYLGARWAVFVGGILIAIGHFLLAFEPLPFFFSGLGFLIAGVGLLKPNISTQVGALYDPVDRRRDSAFTIFYMGINLGAFLGPIICGYLRVRYSYHHGFAAAGVGMVIGLVVYILGMRSVARRTAEIAATSGQGAGDGRSADAAGANTRTAPPERHVYRDRSIVLIVLCFFCILFWVGFEQGANVMNIWADKHTNLHIFRARPPEISPLDAVSHTEPAESGLAGVQIAAEQTQSINPLFILLLAPVFAWLWTWMDRRGIQPSTPTKMALGVFFATLAYGAMLAGAAAENRPVRVPLSRVPAGVELTQYGATRLRWDSQTQTVQMNGVLPDLDWMRALGASSPRAYRDAVAELAHRAEQRAEEVRRAKKAGTLPGDATWSVEVVLPVEAGAPNPIAGWPMDNGRPKVAWDSEGRRLVAYGVLSERDRAQVLANGADPEFARALTEVYRLSNQHRVSIGWLVAFYLLLTIGELCLSPVGLSFVTKAAPPGYVGLFMGLWFLTTGGVANWLAHYAGGYWGAMTPTAYFLIFGGIAAGATVLMLLLLRVLKPLLHGLN